MGKSHYDLRSRIRERLLPELKAGQVAWYYISVATNDRFCGGYLIRACGPTDAWRILHLMGWWEDGASTNTTGPIADEALANIPEEQRWRKLTREEALHLGE